MGDQTKQQHEMSVARRFVEFMRAGGVELGTPIPGDIRTREPDAVCPASGTGIEIASAYYNKEEAKDAWAPARGKPEQSRRLVKPGEAVRDALDRSPVLMNFNEALLSELRRIMLAHCDKTYSMGAYLVLDAAHPGAAITTSDDADALVPFLELPKGCPFIAAYLALNRNFSTVTDFFELPREQSE